MSEAAIAAMGRTVSGKRGPGLDRPLQGVSGISTSDDTREPATGPPDWRYPRMYPTARRAGATSSASTAFGSTGRRADSSLGKRYARPNRSLSAAPAAIPRKIQTPAPDRPVVASSTTAQARPSWYGRLAAARTSNRQRRG